MEPEIVNELISLRMKTDAPHTIVELQPDKLNINWKRCKKESHLMHLDYRHQGISQNVVGCWWLVSVTMMLMESCGSLMVPRGSREQLHCKSLAKEKTKTSKSETLFLLISFFFVKWHS